MAAGDAVRIESSLPHGHLAAVHTMARTLGLPALLGPPGRHRDLALRADPVPGDWPRPPNCPRCTGWADNTLGADLGVTGAGTDEIYAAMDWLARPPGRHRKAVSRKRHLDPTVNPSRIAMFDLSSSWVTGGTVSWPRAATPATAKKGCEQIEYGLLTDPDGPTGGDPGVPRQHRRPDRLHRRGRPPSKTPSR